MTTITRDRHIAHWDAEDVDAWEAGGKKIAKRNLIWSIFAHRRRRDVAGAVAELESVLTEQTRMLGADHRDTIETREELVRWRRPAD